MKLLKYRSVFALATAIGLSVFLFTACEKESDGGPASKPDRLEKFKRLRFSGEASTSTSSGSGTFIGNGSSISYTPPGGGSPTFTPTEADGPAFTDPMSTGTSFSVSQSFSLGGGTVSLGGTSYDLDFGFCASSDIFGSTSDIGGRSDSSENNNIEVFIGVAGDFNLEEVGEDEAADLGIDLLLYVFSYNGASDIGEFANFEGGEAEDAAFVIAVEYDDSKEDFEGNFYFSTDGSVDFSGSNVTLSGVRMAKVDFSSQFNELSSTSVSLQAFLECGSIEFEEE